MANSVWLGGSELNAGAFARVVALAGALDLAVGSLAITSEFDLENIRALDATTSNSLVVTQSATLDRRKVLATNAGTTRIEVLPTQAAPSVLKSLASDGELGLLTGQLLWSSVDELSADATLTLSGVLYPYDDILTSTSATLTVTADSGVATLNAIKPMASNTATLTITTSTVEQLRAGMSAAGSMTMVGHAAWNVYDDSAGVEYALFGGDYEFTITAAPFAHPLDLITLTPVGGSGSLELGEEIALKVAMRKSLSPDVATMLLQDDVTMSRQRPLGATSNAAELTANLPGLIKLRAAMLSTGSVVSVNTLSAAITKDMQIDALDASATMTADTSVATMTASRRLYANGQMSLSSSVEMEYAERLDSAYSPITLETFAEIDSALKLESHSNDFVVESIFLLERITTLEADGAVELQYTIPEIKLAVRLDADADLVVDAVAEMEFADRLDADGSLSVSSDATLLRLDFMESDSTLSLGSTADLDFAHRLDADADLSVGADADLLIEKGLDADAELLVDTSLADLHRLISFEADAVLAVLETEADMLTGLYERAPQERTFTELAKDAAFVAPEETRTFYVA